jgi:predicted ATPase/DNA-binding CsgD family transcriptional regulator
MARLNGKRASPARRLPRDGQVREPDLAPGTLPRAQRGFVGRRTELATLAKVLAGTRLLTMVGPAGVGKTCLAIRLASIVRARYPQGIWFVQLASVTDPLLLTHTVAGVFRVREQPGQSSAQRLASRLRGHMLLILDNCEHLVDSCAELAATLLHTCPDLHILATSREPLETEGDTIWRVAPLSVPASSAVDAAELGASEAVQLFVARARERSPRFALTDSNSAAIGEICRQVDGLPLALELAAGQIGSMTEGDIATRLRLGLALQVTGQTGTPPRQRTLHATLQWSHHLLSEPEQVLFRRLAVFVQGWNLPAAEAVCADDGLSSSGVVTELDRLVARSLVMRVDHHDGVRYRFLNIVRTYALEQLLAADERDAIRNRHLKYMLSVAERVAPEELNAAHARLLGDDQENLRAAIAWALTANDVESGMRLATAACSLWYFRSQYSEGCDWLERTLSRPTADNSIARARAGAWLGQLLQIRGEFASAQRWIADALEQHQVLQDRRGCALSIGMLGHLALMRGELERARTLFAEAAKQLHELGHPIEVASLVQSAIVAIELNALQRARSLIDQCEAQGRELNAPLAGWLLFLKGRLAAACDDTLLAESLLTEALQLSYALPEQQAIIVTLLELGHVQLVRHASARASWTFAEAIELASASGERLPLVRALEGLAGSVAADHPSAGIRLAGAAAGLRSAMGASAWPSDRRRVDAWLPAARRALTSSLYRAAWESGRAAGVDAAVAFARTLAVEPLDTPRLQEDRLTRREREVVVLLGSAFSNQKIAAELSISPATARTHVDHVLAKLGLHTRAQVAVWASKRKAMGGSRGPSRLHNRAEVKRAD